MEHWNKMQNNLNAKLRDELQDEGDDRDHFGCLD